MSTTLILAGAIAVLIIAVVALATKIGKTKQELEHCKNAIKTYEKNAKIDNSPDVDDPALRL